MWSLRVHGGSPRLVLCIRWVCLGFSSWSDTACCLDPIAFFLCEDPIADFWGGMVLNGGVEFLLARLDFSLNFVGKNTVAGCVDHVLGGREVLTTNGGKLDRTSNIPGKEW